MIIDAHIHLWNPLHGKDAEVDREALRWGKAREGDKIYYAAPPAFEDSQSTYERALAHMDWIGVDRAVVRQEFMDGKQDDYLARVRRECPERFSCTALFTKDYYDDPLGVFERSVLANHLQGLLIITRRFPELATPKMMPLWQACAERGYPLVMKDGEPPEIRKLVQAVPNLKIVMSHFAGVFGPIEVHRERVRLAADYENVFIDSGALTFRQRYPFPVSKERLQEAVETAGANKIAWGTDYPRPGLAADSSYKQQLEFITIECDFLSDAQRAEILGGTALRVYNWDK